jgi:hypothetical protein
MLADSPLVYLVPIKVLRDANGLLKGVEAEDHAPKAGEPPFASAPPYAFISYKQLAVADGQKLTAHDVLAACGQAEMQGATHVWIDELCGAKTIPYNHQTFVSSLRHSLEHCVAVVVVGDGGCTERPPTSEVPQYMCRLWTRFELRVALEMRTLHFASPAHRAALLSGRGRGVQSRLLWLDPTAQIPSGLADYPRLLKLADVLSLALVYVGFLLLILAVAAFERDPDPYVTGTSAAVQRGGGAVGRGGSDPVTAADWTLFLFKICCVIIPLIAGPLGVRLFLLERYERTFRETANIHSLRRALRNNMTDLAHEFADVAPYEMPCYELCDRLIVADLMGHREDVKPGGAARAFWANVLVQALLARGGQAAQEQSGKRVLRRLLSIAVHEGKAEWAAALREELRTFLTAAPEAGARSQAHAGRLQQEPLQPPQPPQQQRGWALLNMQSFFSWFSTAPSTVEVAAEASTAKAKASPDDEWPGARLPLRLLMEMGASITVDLAAGYASIRAGPTGALQLERLPDRPTWRWHALTEKSATHTPLSRLEDVRHYASLAADVCFWLVAFVSGLSITDDYIDQTPSLRFDTAFSFDASRSFLDGMLAPAVCLWGVGEVISVFLAFVLPSVLVGCPSWLCVGARARELRTGRFHGWGGIFLLVEADLLAIFARAFLRGADQGELRVARAAETSIDVYFQTFWDNPSIIGLRVILVFFLLVPARALEAVRFVALSPRWLRARAEGFYANLLVLFNPHFTGRPFAPDDELVDMCVPDALLPPLEAHRFWVYEMVRGVVRSQLRQLPKYKSVRQWPSRAGAKAIIPGPGRAAAAPGARAAAGGTGRGGGQAGQRAEPVASRV